MRKKSTAVHLHDARSVLNHRRRRLPVTQRPPLAISVGFVLGWDGRALLPSTISLSCTPDLHFHLIRMPEPLLWKVSFTRARRTTTKLLRTTSSMLVWAFNDGTKLFFRICVGR